MNKTRHTPEKSRESRPRKRTRKSFEKLAEADRLSYLAALGHLAPSTHNVQPWRFRVNTEKRTISFEADLRFVLPESDPSGKQAVMSVGCALENVRIGASYFGYTPRITYARVAVSKVSPQSVSRKQPEFVPLAHMKIEPSRKRGNVPDALFSSLFSRSCARGEYKNEVPPKALVHALRGVSAHADVRGCKLALFTGEEDRLRLAELVAQAESYVLNTEAFQKELGDWLLPNDTKKRRGIPGIFMRLDDKNARRIHHGLKRGSLRPEDALKVTTGLKNAVGSSPALCLITAAHEDVAHWLRAGQMLERSLLACELRGMHTSIHAGITEVPLITTTCVSLFSLSGIPVAFFRVGNPRDKKLAGTEASPRAPLHEVVCIENQ